MLVFNKLKNALHSFKVEVVFSKSIIKATFLIFLKSWIQKWKIKQLLIFSIVKTETNLCQNRDYVVLVKSR